MESSRFGGNDARCACCLQRWFGSRFGDNGSNPDVGHFVVDNVASFVVDELAEDYLDDRREYFVCTDHAGDVDDRYAGGAGRGRLPAAVRAVLDLPAVSGRL